ncbi:MAG TPA: dTDP-4-dehydrorhamnose reductase [Spirochaetaceae bacterium]|nr:dTDP-4-dehydrorhamnose reductase [Spirochaetaceae bacterium]
MIWLTGAQGLLGRSLITLLRERGLPFVATGRELDIRDDKALEGFAAPLALDWLINCAAYTDVDGAESDEDIAYAVNARGAENLARLCLQKRARLIHLSTDYVFDGSSTTPYTEDMRVSPVNAYGRSKAEGERLVAARLPEAHIVRSAWLYGAGSRGFVPMVLRSLLRLGRPGAASNGDEVLRAVSDQLGSPTYADDLARAIISLVSLPALPGGIYHCAGAGTVSRYGLACDLARLAFEYGLCERLVPVVAAPATNFKVAARRPANSALSSGKLAALGIAAPRWQDGLERFFADSYGAEARQEGRAHG